MQRYINILLNAASSLFCNFKLLNVSSRDNVADFYRVFDVDEILPAMQALSLLNPCSFRKISSFEYAAPRV